MLGPDAGAGDNRAGRVCLCLPLNRRRANIEPSVGVTGTPMIISCPECRTKFCIDPSALGVGGRTAGCGKCAHIWLQAPPDREAEIVREEGTDQATREVPSDNAESAGDGDIDADECDWMIDWEEPTARNDEGVSVCARRWGRPAAAAVPIISGRALPLGLGWWSSSGLPEDCSRSATAS